MFSEHVAGQTLCLRPTSSDGLPASRFSRAPHTLACSCRERSEEEGDQGLGVIFSRGGVQDVGFSCSNGGDKTKVYGDGVQERPTPLLVKTPAWQPSADKDSPIWCVTSLLNLPSMPFESYTKKTSGREVYYTASSLLVILKNSCNKLHCQQFFKLKLFSYKIARSGTSSGNVERDY